MKPLMRESSDGIFPAFGAVVCFVLVILLGLITHFAAQNKPSFDGAMNLQVAYSLSQGDGYRRTYADRLVFPREVQTNAPYILPSAAVFATFGVGKWQAQSANLAYLCGVVLLCVLILRNRFSLLAGALCGLLVLCTPGIIDYGLSGYGEIPALFWVLLSGIIFPWRETSPGRIVLSGICLGLSLSTKTVMLICFASFGLVYALAIATNERRHLSARFGLLAILAGASLLPLALVELWRLASLGGLDDYRSWWQIEINAIGRQAGTEPGYVDTESRLEKLLLHLRLLSGMYGIHAWVIPVWIAAPPLLAITWLAFTRSWRRNGLLICLVLASTLYFVWWLFITPTQKAWHRRILDGSLLLNIAWVYIAAMATAAIPLNDLTSRFRRAGTGLIAAFLVFCSMLFASVDLRPKLINGPPPQSGFDAAVEIVRTLPPDAVVYGIGWLSAPAISLLAERPLMNFNDLILSEITHDEHSYLVVDWPAIERAAHAPVTSMYPATTLLDSPGVKVFRLDLKSPGFQGLGSSAPDDYMDSSVDLATVLPPNIRGFNDVDGSQHRWMTSKGLIRLAYDGHDYLTVSAYAPPLARYVRKEGLLLSAFIDGCPLGSREVADDSLTVTQFHIPEGCRPEEGHVVVVQLSFNDLIANLTTEDERALSLIVENVGFDHDCRHPSCRLYSADGALAAADTPPAAPPAGTAVDAGVLQATPRVIDLCKHPDGLAALTIDWTLPDSHEGMEWSIWVSAPGQARTLWMKSTETTGYRLTGRWVRDQTLFELIPADGRVLDSLIVRSQPCAP